MTCPCEDCLCVPICRHKRYIPLIKCSILKDYLIKSSWGSPCNKIDTIVNILNPTRWTYRYEKHKGKNTAMISISSVQNKR
jgi:hypothetical protein